MPQFSEAKVYIAGNQHKNKAGVTVSEFPNLLIHEYSALLRNLKVEDPLGGSILINGIGFSLCVHLYIAFMNVQTDT